MSDKIPFETFTKPTCRGSYLYGSACGRCEKCEWELKNVYNRADLAEAKRAPVEQAKESCGKFYKMRQDVESLKQEAKEFVFQKIKTNQADHPLAVEMLIDSLHERGLLNPDTEALKRENERLQNFFKNFRTSANKILGYHPEYLGKLLLPSQRTFQPEDNLDFLVCLGRYCIDFLNSTTKEKP